MIYVSTGGSSGQSALKTAQQYIEVGIDSIELSGGMPEKDLLIGLKRLRSMVNFAVHNYFPPPDNPFVFNLATPNEELAHQSMCQVETAIIWALELGHSFYSFHAGFLLDPKVSDLGRRIPNQGLVERELAMNLFLDRVNSLARFAEKEGVTLLIENNVLSQNNHVNFSGNPFLMADAHECVHVMKNTPDNVRLLVDVAHLKVSANSLNFDPVEFLALCDGWISGYHLSDNDGHSDSNGIVTANSWFWPYLKKDLTYYSLEIYKVDVSVLVKQRHYVTSQLAKNYAKY
jgi:sugar phosphate isomerase/epimerase